MGEKSVIIRHLRNPAYGLIPLLVFTILLNLISISWAIATGLGLSLLGVFVVRKHSRMLYDVSAITFACAILPVLMYQSLNAFGVLLLVEIIFVGILVLSRLLRSKLIQRLAKTKNSKSRNYLAESFRVAFQTQYAMFIHLLLVLLYYVFSDLDAPFFSPSQITVLLSIILWVIIAMEVLRFRFLDKKLNKEEWLPVVTASGEVMGRVAKSVTKEMKNKFMHPVVRVALINNGMIYLKKRDAARVLNPGLLDYPFEKYMEYNHDIDEAVHNAIRREIGIDDIPLRFLLKYIFENNDTKRLVFLYVSIIDDDEKFSKLHLSDGKLWTENQIEDNMDSNIFSESFELEFGYLKNTILLNDKLKPFVAS